MEKNPNWKGGITLIQQKIRNSPEHLNWSKKVLRNYHWACYSCESKKNLIAHHILSFSEFPEYRFNEDIGQCLCRGCHAHLHAKSTYLGVD